MSFLSYSANYQGVVDVFVHDPSRYLPFTQLLAEVMNGESEMSKPQREMIALYVSAYNNCDYCIGSHKAVLTEYGIDAATISDIEKGTHADKKSAALLGFAAELTKDPGAVTQADVDRLCAAGWSEQTVEDVIGVVSSFAFLNRLADGFGIKGSPTGFAQAGKMIAENGYGPVVAMLQEKAA